MFNVLSLCAPLFSVNKDDRSTCQGDFTEEFDVREEESLWTMIRKCLVCYTTRFIGLSTICIHIYYEA